MPLTFQQDDASLSQEEVAAIVRRAGELQQVNGSATSEGGRLTLAEVRRSAEELGLSSELIEQAAQEIRTKGLPQRRSFWGGPWRTDLTATVDATFAEEDHADLVEVIRDASGRLGEAVPAGNAFEWTSSSPDTLHASVRAVPEGVRVRVKAWCGEWAAVYYMAAFLPCLLLSIAVPASNHWPFEVGGPLALAIFASGFTVARAGFNGLCRKRRRTAENVLAALRQRLTSREGRKQDNEPTVES
jgi:hypothetical protein